MTRRLFFALAVLGSACAESPRDGADFQPFQLPDGSPADAVIADGCGSVEVTFVDHTPTVMLLIDQSNSMADHYIGEKSRWQVVREALVGLPGVHEALVGSTGGVLRQYSDKIRFGATLYHSDLGFDDRICPVLTKTSPPRLGALTLVETMLTKEVPGGDTPTGESVDAVVRDLIAFHEPGPKYIVLATDGEPDTCAVPNPDHGQHESVAAVQRAFTRGIHTFVMSVGTDVSAAHLQDLANAGSGLPLGTSSTKVRQATDAVGVKRAFDDMLFGVRSCFIAIEGQVTKPSTGRVFLTAGSKRVEIPKLEDDPAKRTGWRIWNAPTTDRDQLLELVGDACESIKTGDRTVEAIFPCDGYIR
ncbi:MAG: vWA domain-containing protein [Polyangiales bacterium]